MLPFRLKFEMSATLDLNGTFGALLISVIVSAV